MISAWEVYLVMQLDKISNWLCSMAVIGLVVVAVFTLSACAMRGAGAAREREFGEAIHNKLLKVWWIPVFLLFVDSILPSSKTAAAMIILPALTNEEVMEQVKKEGGEIYEIAKQALREVILSKKKEEKVEE